MEIEWRLSEPVWDDERSVWKLGETPDYFVDMIPMIYNYRIVLTPKSMPKAYDVGWCYPSYVEALLASLSWQDPENTEPIGAIKRVGSWPL